MVMLRCMAQVLGNAQVKAKLLIKPLCHGCFSQLAFACSKSTLETLEQGVKFDQSYQKRYQNGIPDVKTLHNQ